MLSPPPGWADLQERARRTKDPTELAKIIDEMNALLTEYEKTSGDGLEKESGRKGDRKISPKSSTKKNPG
ncbi:MAG: hypothetical protein WBS24_08355 [Terriglobales bacterium]